MNVDNLGKTGPLAFPSTYVESVEMEELVAGEHGAAEERSFRALTAKRAKF